MYGFKSSFHSASEWHSCLQGCSKKGQGRQVGMYLGEYAGAIEHFERAMRLSPLDPLTYFASTGIAFAHAFAGRYDEAISWATKALHEQPNWATALRVAATANALSDRMVEARAAIACLREVDPALRL